MSKRHKPRESIFVVVRHDAFQPEPQHAFTVKEALWDPQAAAAEVDRLNALASGREVQYFAQETRLYPPGTAAGDVNGVSAGSEPAGEPESEPGSALPVGATSVADAGSRGWPGFELLGRRYHVIRASDVVHDGMSLELHEVTPPAAPERPSPILEVFYSDRDGRMTLYSGPSELPLELVEWFIASARRLLPPSRDVGNSGSSGAAAP